ncbi:hypothetical protein NJC38_26715, partial [Pseudomonas sp. 21LCFQ010]|uniref:hypothetical protein n=1 Tax=Pseudomonas sp. 21LCFQ010 TaxID=2957506 RepID=UPI0020981786
YRRTRNRKSSSDSWDGGLVEGSWTEGYFSTGQMACGDLIGESLEVLVSFQKKETGTGWRNIQPGG